MKAKASVERTGLAQGQAQEVSENSKGGGYASGKAATKKTKRKAKGGSTENIKKPF